MSCVNKYMLVRKTNKLSKKKTDKTKIAELPVEDAISIAEKKEIDTMLDVAKAEFGKIVTRPAIERSRRLELDTLKNMISEFMGPFLLIGYDLHNNPVEMVSAENHGETDALVERLRRVKSTVDQNIIATNGNDPYGVNI